MILFAFKKTGAIVNEIKKVTKQYFLKEQKRSNILIAFDNTFIELFFFGFKNQIITTVF